MYLVSAVIKTYVHGYKCSKVFTVRESTLFLSEDNFLAAQKEWLPGAATETYGGWQGADNSVFRALAAAAQDRNPGFTDSQLFNSIAIKHAFVFDGCIKH